MYTYTILKNKKYWEIIKGKNNWNLRLSFHQLLDKGSIKTIKVVINLINKGEGQLRYPLHYCLDT